MKTPDEIMDLIQENLSDGCDNLWDALTPEERRRAFTKLIIEWLESTY